jgi:glucokinase
MTRHDSEPAALVGDVGGTNCRFALASRSPGAPWSVSEVRSYHCDDFPTFEDAATTYLRQAGAPISGAAIAVAGPVEDGAVAMTNRAWRITERDLASALGVGQCRVMNDFEALAYALPALSADQVRTLGPSLRGAPRATLAALGAGTGLGVAAYVRGPAGEAVLASEGGHAAFAPQDDLELEVWRWLARRLGGRVSIEDVLSGHGLVNLHRALSEIGGSAPMFDEPAAITNAADRGEDRALDVADLFVRIFGSVAGDLALVFGARGGVFVAGGVSLRLLTGRTEAAFRARFEAKGAFSPYVAAIPTSLITYPQPGILGAACSLGELTSQP